MRINVFGFIKKLTDLKCLIVDSFSSFDLTALFRKEMSERILLILAEIGTVDEFSISFRVSWNEFWLRILWGFKVFFNQDISDGKIFE